MVYVNVNKFHTENSYENQSSNEQIILNKTLTYGDHERGLSETTGMWSQL